MQWKRMRTGRKQTHTLAWLLVALPLIAACSATSDPDPFANATGAGVGSGSMGSWASAGTAGGSDLDFDGGTPGDPGFQGDPTTCEDAAALHTYVGCDFWPTVTANWAWSIFDYAVIVANAGDVPADVTITRDG